MKKTLIIITIGVLAIAGHVLWHPDATTSAARFISGQMAQAFYPLPAALSAPVVAQPVASSSVAIDMSVSDPTIIVLVIAGIATLIFLGYTNSSAFRTRR